MVVPTFNHRRFLSETLAALGRQSHPSLEVIVVDDGSTDGTAELLAASPPLVRSIRQDHAGPSAARNAGIDSARGSYITFVDADDICLPTRISRQLAHLLERPEPRAVLARHRPLVEGGADAAQRLRRDPVWDDLGGVEPMSAMLPTEIARKLRFDPSYAVGEGIEWLGRLKDSGVAVDVCHEVLYLKRIHAGNLSRDRSALRAALLRTARERVARQANRPPEGAVGDRA